MPETVSEFEKIYELIKEEVKRTEREIRVSDPKLDAEIDSIFSLSFNIENITSSILKLVMRYAKHPKRARAIIPSLQVTMQDVITTRNNYNKAKKFPHLYPFNLSALQLQYNSLRQLWNTKVSKLILDAAVSTQVEASMWRAIADRESSGGLVL